MKKHVQVLAGAVAIAVAAAIPATGAFGSTTQHCDKIGTAFGEARSASNTFSTNTTTALVYAGGVVVTHKCA
ncbi:MAG: hypothetical protein JO086_17120 [Acidimicrobiia bacterium]|nr:hypothetical protein [Acidimicrobiia bacterium]